MRLRRNPNAENTLMNCKNYFIQNPIKNNWRKYFQNDSPIYLEIGMGKGDFLISNALKNPNINYIGLEKNISIIAIAIKKCEKIIPKLINLKIISLDAQEINTVFNNNEISKIFLNFSDPWPKARHTKNRLTNPVFLKLYKKVLNKEGIVEFKSDNDSLFNYSIKILRNINDYEIIYETVDLYQNLECEVNKKNIPTEYEKRFSQLGKNIYKIIFKFKD